MITKKYFTECIGFNITDPTEFRSMIDYLIYIRNKIANDELDFPPSEKFTIKFLESKFLVFDFELKKKNDFWDKLEYLKHPDILDKISIADMEEEFKIVCLVNEDKIDFHKVKGKIVRFDKFKKWEFFVHRMIHRNDNGEYEELDYWCLSEVLSGQAVYQSAPNEARAVIAGYEKMDRLVVDHVNDIIQQGIDRLKKGNYIFIYP